MKLEPNLRSATLNRREVRSSGSPFCFYPFTVLSSIFDALAGGLSSYRTNVSSLIIINDRWNFGISANLFLGRKTRILS
jgi:hypothetical protein